MSQVADDPSAQARAAWIAAKISDKTLRAAFRRAVTDKALIYSAAERKQIQQGLDMEAQVTNSSALKPIKMSTPLLDTAVAMTSKDGQHNIVQSSATIRAPLMDVLAYLFCLEQAINDLLKEERGVNVHNVLGRENDHTAMYHWGMRAPAPLSHRDFVFRCVYKQLAVGEHITSIKSTEFGVAPAQNTVRGSATRLLRFTAVTPTVTRFTATSTFDLNGSIPRFVSDTLTTPGAARAPLFALGYFVQIKETAELDAGGQDARALGQLLVRQMEPVRTKKKLLESKLHVFLFRTTVLRELCDARPWFEALLHQVLLNEAQIKNKGVSGVEGFTQEDGRATGAKLALLLLKKPPLTAVDVVSPAHERRARAREREGARWRQRQRRHLYHRYLPPHLQRRCAQHKQRL